jgi:hypothetical protein
MTVKKPWITEVANLGVLTAAAQSRPIPSKRMGIRHAEVRPEIRMTFRDQAQRHLSVVSRVFRKRSRLWDNTALDDQVSTAPAEPFQLRHRSDAVSFIRPRECDDRSPSPRTASWAIRLEFAASSSAQAFKATLLNRRAVRAPRAGSSGNAAPNS